MAFLSTPGTERLYSGVTKSTASAAAHPVAERAPGRRRVGVQVFVVERQIADLDDVEFAAVGAASAARALAILRLSEAVRRLPTITATLRAFGDTPRGRGRLTALQRGTGARGCARTARMGRRPRLVPPFNASRTAHDPPQLSPDPLGRTRARPRDPDAGLRLRPRAVRGGGEDTDLPHLHLRLSQLRGRQAAVRLHERPPRAAGGRGRRPDLHPLQQPNLQIVEERLAVLEGAEACAVFSSGMAAILTALLAVVEPGQSVVRSRPLYGGTETLFDTLLARFGVVSEAFVDGTDRGGGRRGGRRRLEPGAGRGHLRRDAGQSDQWPRRSGPRSPPSPARSRERQGTRPMIIVDNTLLGPALPVAAASRRRSRGLFPDQIRRRPQRPGRRLGRPARRRR